MLTYFSGLFEIEVKGVHDQSIYTPSTILTLTICDQYFKEKGEYCKVRIYLFSMLPLDRFWSRASLKRHVLSKYASGARKLVPLILLQKLFKLFSKLVYDVDLNKKCQIVCVATRHAVWYRLWAIILSALRRHTEGQYKKACRVDEHRYHTKLMREPYCHKPLNMWTFASLNLRTCFLDYIIVKNKFRAQLVILQVKEIQLNLITSDTI